MFDEASAAPAASSPMALTPAASAPAPALTFLNTKPTFCKQKKVITRARTNFSSDLNCYEIEWEK
jgi:hypothetical protein